jgi:hypothetical protein
MSIRFARIKKCLELDDKLAFGVHSGKSIGYMLEFEPEYLLWASKNNAVVLNRELEKRCFDKALRAKAEKEVAKSKEVTYAHSDQDDWWEDVPF